MIFDLNEAEVFQKVNQFEIWGNNTNFRCLLSRG